jgi:hypothetical protein
LELPGFRAHTIKKKNCNSLVNQEITKLFIGIMGKGVFSFKTKAQMQLIQRKLSDL